ncbi:MAG: MerR family transcriptional regulator [Rhodoblastus sp.]
MDKSPDAFRTISEVAEELGLPQHVLRFWETRFSQIKPMKRTGGRRYYRPDDVELVRAIKTLLYGEGYTIKGVQRLLKENGVRALVAAVRAGVAPAQSVLAFGADEDDEAVESAQTPQGDDDAGFSSAPAVQSKPTEMPGEMAAELAAELAECARILRAARLG